jgi:hypothetical protein
MKRTTILASTIILLLARPCLSDTPSGFSWINIESDKTTMASVRHALHDTSITAIREVGVKSGFALVMTASRESGAPTPDFDRWTIYNISLATGRSQILVSGYGVKLLDWIGVAKDELAITYYDCWECEAASFFTTLRFKNSVGWMARWPNRATQDSTYPRPGAVAAMTDVGDPSDDTDVDLVFAVVAEPRGDFAVGSWTHSRNSKSGKIEDDVERYSIDPKTKEDRVQKLEGNAALQWEREICTESRILIQPSAGQKSDACRLVIRTAGAHPATSK